MFFLFTLTRIGFIHDERKSFGFISKRKATFQITIVVIVTVLFILFPDVQKTRKIYEHFPKKYENVKK